MANLQITAVLFDWDLTLAHVLGEVTEAERLTALFNSQGLNCTLTEIRSALKQYQDDIKQNSSSCKHNPQTRRAIIRSYFQILSYVGFSERDWEFGNRLYDAHSFLPTFLYPDTLPTLDSLRKKGFTLGIISNHAHSARVLIEQHLAEFIPPRHIIISQEVGVHKPAKTIFRLAAARLGIPPMHCMFVGNDLVVDAIGAVEQGRFDRGLWLDRNGTSTNEPLPHRVYHITTLNQVVDFI